MAEFKIPDCSFFLGGGGGGGGGKRTGLSACMHVTYMSPMQGDYHIAHRAKRNELCAVGLHLWRGYNLFVVSWERIDSHDMIMCIMDTICHLTNGAAI